MNRMLGEQQFDLHEDEEFAACLDHWQDEMCTVSGHKAVAPRALYELIWAQQEKSGQYRSTHAHVVEGFNLDHIHTISEGALPRLSKEEVIALFPEVLDKVNELMAHGVVSKSFHIDGRSIGEQTMVAYGIEVDGHLNDPEDWRITEVDGELYWCPGFTLAPKVDEDGLVSVVDKVIRRNSTGYREDFTPQVMLSPLHLANLSHKERMDILVQNIEAARAVAPISKPVLKSLPETEATGAFAPVYTLTLPVAEILPPRRHFRELVAQNLGVVASLAAVPMHLIKR